MAEPANAECACGTPVQMCLNTEFPSMSVVLDTDAHPDGEYRVGYYFSGQRFAERHPTARNAPRYRPHKDSCPLDQPRFGRWLTPANSGKQGASDDA